jgi:hypothetical protein
MIQRQCTERRERGKRAAMPYLEDMPRKTLERHEPLARDDVSPLRDIGVRGSPRGLLEAKRVPQAPMPRKTLERHEPVARGDVSPLKGTGVRRSPRGLLETEQAPQAPMPRCVTDQRLGGRLAQAPGWSQTPGRECLATAPHHCCQSAPRGPARPSPSTITDAKTGPPRRRPTRPY